MADTKTFRVIALPLLHDAAEPDTKDIALAERWREVRLKALKSAPDAFAAKYEVEKARGLEQTLTRLSNPMALHFVAIKDAASNNSESGDSKDLELIMKADWLGTIVLLGPQEETGAAVPADKDPFNRMTGAERAQKMLSNKDILTSPAGLHYHLNGMFVDPAAQRGGLGRALVDAALGRAQAEAAKYKARLRISISVYDSNVAARKLYAKAGFEEVFVRPTASQDREVIDMEISLAAAS